MNDEHSQTSTSGPGSDTSGSELPPDIRHLSETQLAALGVSRIAYVRPITVNGVVAFSIHAADGTPIALAADFDIAIAAVNQNEMVPALVH